MTADKRGLSVAELLELVTEFCADHGEHITRDKHTAISLYSTPSVVIQLAARGNAAATVAWAVNALANPAIEVTSSAGTRHVAVAGTFRGLEFKVVSLTEDRNDALRVDVHIEWTVENTRGAVISPEKLREIAVEVFA